MPRIEAATVAEHRALREQSVIGAAVGILVTEGPGAVTPGAVAREAGLARTSVYQYFPSTGALLGAALEALAAQRVGRITQALTHAGPDPYARITAYVRTTVQMAHDSAAPQADLTPVPEDVRSRLTELDEHFYAPLLRALTQLRIYDSSTVIALLESALHAAGTMVDHAADVERVTATVTDFVMAGIRACAPPAQH